MKKKVVFLAVIAILLIIIILVRFSANSSNKENQNNLPSNSIANSQGDSNMEDTSEPSIPTVSQIELNSKQYINQMEEVEIKGTTDTFMITERVKWVAPENDEDLMGSFDISIPYTFTIDGTKYDGIYCLNDPLAATPDNNPKYDFEVLNLTQNGDIQIEVSTK